MTLAAGHFAGHSADGVSCRLVVRKEKGLTEILQFISAGVEIGQQVVALADPSCLKEIAQGLGEVALRPDCLLRSGRLVFLTAPNCLSQLVRADDAAIHRGPLHRNGSMLRWVTDWSWAYRDGMDAATLLGYQRLIHGFVRSFTALSLCTVHWEKLERSSLLAMLADHRRAIRSTLRPA